MHQPAAEAFSISGGFTAITAAHATGTILVVTLGPGCDTGRDAANRLHPTASGGALRDADQGGLSVAAFELDIENNSELTPAPTPLVTGGLVDAYVITLDFSEPLDPRRGPAANVVRDLGTRGTSTRGLGRRRQSVASGASTRGARPVPLDQLQPGSIRRSGIAAKAGFRSSSGSPVS